MDGNARLHRTLAVEELLEREDVTRMDWPAYSSDLNPIEHVWDALGRCIAARLHHPENTQQLKQMLIEEWVLLPQEMLHQLVLNLFKDLGSDTAFNIMLCDAQELADEIDIPAKIELTQPRHTVRRKNVNFDYEARDDPIEDPTLKYKAEFIFSH
ncbi:transposable element Tc3 transposase [Trichonephila clavipes]|nr:transposable element Tc3 transposase [Trichonephila clavipes]